MMFTKNTPRQLQTALWGLVGAIALVVGLAMPVMAMEASPRFPLDEGKTIPVQGPRQVFRDDLTLESGQVIDEDVFVYSGNVDMRGDARITGDLIVFSGNVKIGEAAVVEGDVTNYSGNVTVAGAVGGDLAAMSGNVEIESTARIDGDVSVVSGRIDRKEGASVRGNVVQGPSFRLPGGIGPTAPGAPNVPGISFGTQSRGFFGTLAYFVGRLFAAALMVALVMLLVGGLFYLRPQTIANARRQMREQLALSAVVGVLANLTALFLAGLLAITICLLPLALIPLLLLLGVNIVGWAVASQIVGERIVNAAKQEVQPSLAILVGAFALTGVSAFLWAMGGCFQFIASLLVFAVSSLGAGAVLVPWINRRRGLGGATGDSGGDHGGGSPRGPQPSGPAPSYASDVETDVAAPLDYMTAEEINEAAQRPSTASARRGATGAAATTSAAATGGAQKHDSGADIDDEATQDQDLTEPIGYVTAGEVNQEAEQRPQPRQRSRRREERSGDDEATQDQDLTAPIGYTTAGEVNDEAEQAPKPRTRSRRREEAGADDEITQDQDLTEPIGYVTAQEVVTGDVVSEGDDFSQIKGIGPTYARRLKEAGYTTFAQLAAATPEEVGTAMGLPADRVRRAEVIDQAKVLARK